MCRPANRCRFPFSTGAMPNREAKKVSAWQLSPALLPMKMLPFGLDVTKTSRPSGSRSQPSSSLWGSKINAQHDHPEGYEG